MSRSGLRTATVALAAGAACAAFAPSAPALAQPSGGHAAYPAFTQIQASIQGVTAVSATDAWAVGYSYKKDDVFVDQWDGTAWKPARHPASRTDAAFLAVDASSATDVWAVGSHYVGPKGGKDSWTYIQHFDGKKWTRSRGANPSVTTDVLSAVSARTPSDAWAVGFQSPSEDYPGSPLAEHWNGTKWRAVATPDIPKGCYGSLSGVEALAANDAWAVGTVGCPTYVHTLTLHWDGSAWSTVDSPNPGGKALNTFNAVTSLADGTVWAVGAWSAMKGGTHPMAARWTGSEWETVDVPTGTAKTCHHAGASLIGVDSDGTDLMAVGGRFCGKAVKTLIETWTGKAWKVMPAPSPKLTKPAFSELRTVAVAGADSALTAGATGNDRGDAGFTEHWNGKRWTLY